jgi:hypothetical protein
MTQRIDEEGAVLHNYHAENSGKQETSERSDPCTLSDPRIPAITNRGRK